MAPRKAARRQAEKEQCIINCLPRELIEEIFLRLPESSLLRCTGVCKMWHCIIRDSKFVATHLERAPSCTLLFSPQGSTSSGDLYPSDATFVDEAWASSTLAVPVIGPDDLICGSCNGLLCLYTRTSTIKIANPLTGECLHLQKPVKGLKDDHFSFYRFGFHPATKEYKVLHFYHDSGSYAEGRFNAIQVYTLGDEKWKQVATSENLSLNCVKNSGVIITDGTVYWLTEDSAAHWHHVVVSFDLGDESFAQVHLPEYDLQGHTFGGRRCYWIREIDGMVCVSTVESLDDAGRLLYYGNLQVWALSTTVDQCWNLKYNIDLSTFFFRGVHFVHGNKIMIQSSDKLYYSELLEKNFEIEPSKTVKLLELGGRGEYGVQSYVFVKSLVRLDVYRRAAIVRKPRQGGWSLKKWKAWENAFSRMQELWMRIHPVENEMLLMAMALKRVSKSLPTEVWQRLCLEIDQIVQCLTDFPDQHLRPLQRPNWVGMAHISQALNVRVTRLEDISKAFHQVDHDIFRMLKSYEVPSCQCKQQAM